MILSAMLKNYRQVRQVEGDKARAALHLRNKTDDPQEIREVTRRSGDGSITVGYELWQRVDVEVVTISATPTVAAEEDW